MIRLRLSAAAVAALSSILLPAPAVGQDLYASFGSSVYESDAFCLNSSAFITDYSLGASGDLFGVSASYDNSDWPWPNPPGSTGGGGAVVPASFYLAAARQEDFYSSQGDAIQVTAELFPLAALRRITGGDRSGVGQVEQYLRPFVGVGVHVSSDGETAVAAGGRNVPTYGVKGGTRPVVTYGARLYLPSRDRPIRLQLQYHGTTMFVDEFELETPTGQTITTPSDNLMWGSWSVGVSFRIGG